MIESRLLLLFVLSTQATQSEVSDASVARFTSEITNKGYELFTGRTDASRRQWKKFQIRFLLRRWNKQDWEELNNNVAHLPRSWVNGAPVKIIIHGYSSMDWYTKDKDPFKVLSVQVADVAHAYGNRNASVNVLLVDWTALAISSPSRYQFVVENVETVGGIVGRFMISLALAEVKDFKRFHLIGYSVGAHIAGVAGKVFASENNVYSGRKVGRISGIDPAGAGFDEDDAAERINKNNSLTRDDADFVDVIHCSGSSNNIYAAQLLGQYGSSVIAGHADFYPNGGVSQPGCKKVNEVRLERACSVRKCMRYFVDTVEGVKYYGCPCKSYEAYEDHECDCKKEKTGALMGDPCSPGTNGKFFLKIDSDKEASGVSKYL